MNVSRETHKADHYFDLSEVWFKDIFVSDKPVWSLLEKDFKEKWIEKNLKPNLKGIVREGNLVLKDFSINGGRIEAGAYIHGDQIELREGVTIESGAWVAGPTLLGPKTEVRQGAYVRGGVITGISAVLGHASEIKSSIFLNSAKAPHFAYVGDSILGNRVNLGAGTKVSNLRLDQREIKINFVEYTEKTKIRKFGAIIGDETETGCNSVLNPGTLLGKKCRVFPNVSCVAQYWEPHSRITDSGMTNEV